MKSCHVPGIVLSASPMLSHLNVTMFFTIHIAMNLFPFIPFTYEKMSFKEVKSLASGHINQRL